MRTEGLFGESCLVGPTDRRETATALDNVTLMSWTRSEIELQVEREPRLGIALLQFLVRQCLRLQDRFQSIAVQKTPEQVMLALLQLASDLGTQAPDGSIRVASLTHHTIAEFVGTSREIVTFQMNRLRRMGLIRYSRKFIDIYSAPMRENLKPQGMSLREERKSSPSARPVRARPSDQNAKAGLIGNWTQCSCRTGTPFTVTASNTSLNAAGSAPFGDCLAPPVKLGGVYEWYKTSAFGTPSNGPFGTCGTDSLWGPGLVNLDNSLNRTFVISERFKLKFSAESFNMANMPHHSNPNSSVSSGTFRQALGIANTGREGIDERTFRLGPRRGW